MITKIQNETTLIIIDTKDGKFVSLVNKSVKNNIQSKTHNYGNLSPHYKNLVDGIILFNEESKRIEDLVY